ncbi:MAG: PIN domain-containing protein [Armatimonadetes bacterium]|nr:PIN domain-containing protein [Armatimonadota bacterium]
MSERRNFQDALEPIVYWNTSFAISRWDTNDPFYRECAAFSQRLQIEGVIRAVSDFTYNEFAFHILHRAFLQESRRTGQWWRHILRNQPHIFQAAMNEVEAVKADLEQRTILLPITETAHELAFTLMRRYNLLPTDAYHVAVALDAGVNAFVPLD